MDSTTAMSRALDTIRKLRAELEEARKRDEPLAIVGIGLRMPGGIDDLDGYWAALAEGRSLVRTLPEARKGPFADAWESLPRQGGFLDDVLGFDAGFFGISPREAGALDPQHRLLLEVAWEALENAALPPDRLTGTRVGLYVGISGQEYREWMDGEPDAHWATGNGHSFAAGRVSYALGLTGPAMAVDTACSSSLVALHLARQALYRRECDVALAGGVNLVLSPRSTQMLQQMRALAPDGLCKAFDARANGFTRGEGSGVVVLKRLSDALRDRDRVHAVVHGSAVNQDGRSTGFTAPNVRSQIELIEAALADAGLEPADIGLLEAHGTGTALGDPIEMEAVRAALGRRDGGAPLRVGSVKTNLGHLEAAAGVAGLVKAVLCLRHRAVPPLVHFTTLNPRIDIEGTGIVLPSTLEAWPEDEAGRYAAVSSFGMSGTNAHVILGSAVQAPEDEASAPGRATGPVTGFELAARTPEALRAMAARLAAHLTELGDDDYPAFAYTVTFGRARHRSRATVAAPDRDSALAALRDLAAGEASPAVTPHENDLGDGDPPGRLRTVIDLPNYPWERRPHPARAATGHAPGRVPLYRLEWRPAMVTSAEAASRPVLAGDDEALLDLLAAQARADGLDPLVLGTADDPVPSDAAAWSGFWKRRPPEERASLILAFRATELPGSLEDVPDPAVRGGELCAAVTAAVRGLVDSRAAGSRRAYVVTRAAVQATGHDSPAASDHGLLHGLAPVLGLEFPAAWGGVLDLPATPEVADARTALQVATGQGPEELVAVRAGSALAARLRDASAQDTEPLPVRADATYLVTGGLGGVGLKIVGSLVRRGARHLLLIGRRAEHELGTEATALLDSLRREGIRAVYRSADCADPGALRRACAALDRLPPVRGVIHGAGTLRRVPLAEADAAAFTAAARGKFTGAWWLHLLGREWPLDFFVEVSSVSALWGTLGYGPYAAANGGQDLVAAHRAASGETALSIAFGPWALDGMVNEDDLANLARIGIGPVEPEAGCATLTARAPGGGSHLVACSVDWPRFTIGMAALRRRPLFADLVEEPETSDASGAAPVPGRAVPAGGVRGRVASLVAAALGHDDPDEVRHDVGFLELGLDSIMAVDLAKDVSAEYGREIAVADLFDHPTINELADLIASAPAPTRPAVGPARPAGPARTGDPAPLPGSETAADLPDERAGAAEPIAIIGMAGRFPGADSTDRLWELLAEGRDAVGPVPPDRWDGGALYDPDPLRPGKVVNQEGGFLRDIARFEASFFNISAREAENLDPQHRLLLEETWHALEHAGLDPHALKGSRTGVYVGISNPDYARLLERGGLEGLGAHYGTGTALNAAAGRIAYLLGLRGPALAVDTACSSSLVALHLAARSLRSGETDCAIVGGVNVLASPATSVAISRAHMLSPDGRCKAFSADANGFVRAEGCGALVLKRLSDALRDGDRVLAVVHGSAVNQDGASSALTAPSGRAQSEVIAGALADAGVPGSAVSYLEAHGTGTALGDPIELGAAWSALGDGRRPGEPLHVGSVKSNLGHLESAAGIVGVIKTVLALRHRTLPPTLHCETLNPHVPWGEMNVRVLDAVTPWRAGSGPRLAGVSAFGFTGTNAHVVIGEAPTGPQVREPAPGGPFLVPLSAPDPAGLERLSDRWDDFLTTCRDDDLPSVARTAGAGRAHFPVRRALIGGTATELRDDLREPSPSPPAVRVPRALFLFSGQGSQYFGMGRVLYETEPVFREVIDSCDAAVGDLLDAPLTELMFYGADHDRINETHITQPALVALEVGLAELWRSWGVVPHAMLGHSVGEISAAICAGVMDLATGMELVAHRARMMRDTEPGAMLAVSAPPEQVTAWLADTDLDIAAVNGPRAVTLSGRPEAIADFAARLEGQRVRSRPLPVSRAFHSRLMDPVLDDLHQAIAGYEFHAPRLPLISNLTGRVADDATFDAGYWCRQVRRPVLFHEGAERIRALDIDLCLELGPSRTLGNLVASAGLAPPHGVLASLRSAGKDRAALLRAAKALYERGHDLAWERVQQAPGHDAPVHDGVPLYPFAGSRHWTRFGTGETPTAARAGGARTRPWGRELRSPALTGRVFEFERAAMVPPHLTDHRLYGTVVTPATSHLSTVLSALAGDGGPLTIEDAVCPRALVIEEGERYTAQIVVAGQGERRELTVQSLVDPDRDRWIEHLSGRIVASGDVTPPPIGPATPAEREAFVAAADRHITGDDFYAYIRGLGYTLGPSFRWIADLWVRGDRALVRYTRPSLPDDPADYEIHPGLIDSCFQSIAAFMIDAEAGEAPSLAIPYAMGRLSFRARPGDTADLWGHVRVTRAERLPGDRRQVEAAELQMVTAGGDLVFSAEDFRVRHAPRAVLKQSLREERRPAYRVTWTERPPASRDLPKPRGAVVVRGADPGLGSALCAAVRGLGPRARALAPGEAPPAAGLIVDAGFLGRDWEHAGPDHALRAAVRLSAALREAPSAVPYLVLTDGGTEAAPVSETLRGMLAAIGAEEPERRLVHLVLEPDWTVANLARTLSECLGEAGAEPRLSLGDGPVRVARLTAAPRDVPAAPRPGGGALVTGGLGALGLSVAQILAAQGAEAITLMGRSEPDGTARRVIAELLARGVAVTVVNGDVTDPAACERAVTAGERPLRAVFHLAGVTRDRAFDRLTPEDFEAVFAPKARGAMVLAEAVMERGLDDLEAFVLFSSVSGVLGSAGQTNYAAANGYLDGLAQRLRAQGLPATSVAWGPWVPAVKPGMAASAPAVLKQAERQGVRPVTDDEAAPLLASAARSEEPGLVAVAADFDRYAAHLGGHPRGALVAALVSRGRGTEADEAEAESARRPRGWLRERLDAQPPAARTTLLHEAIGAMVQEVLGEPGEIDQSLVFSDMGLDSITTIDLRTHLAQALDTELPSTAAIDHPTVSALAAFILKAESPLP